MSAFQLSRSFRALPGGCHAAINVGGDPGWIIQAYTDITAQVGDVLNFTYTPDPKTYHDIWDMKTVDAYTACLFTDAQFLHNLTDFLYTLEAPGTRYFACSAQGFHCAIGQKVTVNVLPGASHVDPAAQLSLNALGRAEMPLGRGEMPLGRRETPLGRGGMPLGRGEMRSLPRRLCLEAHQSDGIDCF